jgi:hypothetical protein
VVHSRDDVVIVPPHAERVASAARHLHALVMLDAMPHDAAILPEHIETFWPPIMRFVHAQDGDATQAVLAENDARQAGVWRKAGDRAGTLATAGSERRE